MKKLNLGFFSFTGDGGCMITFLEILNDKYSEWKDKIEFKYIKQMKSKNVLKNLDYSFIEGAISTKLEVKKIKEIRKNSKNIIAIGNCATTGTPSNLRNFFLKKEKKEIEPIIKKFNYLDKVYPISKFIKVDKEISGCPVNEKILIDFINNIIGDNKNA